MRGHSFVHLLQDFSISKIRLELFMQDDYHKTHLPIPVNSQDLYFFLSHSFLWRWDLISCDRSFRGITSWQYVQNVDIRLFQDLYKIDTDTREYMDSGRRKGVQYGEKRRI